MRSSRHAVSQHKCLFPPTEQWSCEDMDKEGMLFFRGGGFHWGTIHAKKPFLQPSSPFPSKGANMRILLPSPQCHSHLPCRQPHTLKELQPWCSLQTGFIRAVIQHTLLLTFFSRWPEMPGAQHTVGSYIAASAVCFAIFTAICQRYCIILHANWLK